MPSGILGAPSFLQLQLVCFQLLLQRLKVAVFDRLLNYLLVNILNAGVMQVNLLTYASHLLGQTWPAHIYLLIQDLLGKPSFFLPPYGLNKGDLCFPHSPLHPKKAKRCPKAGTLS